METPDTPHWTKTPEWGNLHDLLEGVHGNNHLKYFQFLFCLWYEHSFNIRTWKKEPFSVLSFLFWFGFMEESFSKCSAKKISYNNCFAFQIEQNQLQRGNLSLAINKY